MKPSSFGNNLAWLKTVPGDIRRSGGKDPGTASLRPMSGLRFNIWEQGSPNPDTLSYIELSKCESYC